MTLEAENAALKAELAEFKQAKKENFVNGLIAEFKLYPRQKESVLCLLNFAERIEKGEVLDFSEGEQLSALIFNFLEQLPQREELKNMTVEFATKERAIERAMTAEEAQNFEEDFAFLGNAKHGKKTAEELKQLHQKITAYAKANNMSYSEALDAIEKQRGNQ